MSTIVSSGFEDGVDNHQVWFNSTVTQDNADANTGTFSLLVVMADSFSGVQLGNFPYYSGVTGGNSYDCSVWIKEATATMPTVVWNLQWYDVSVALLRTDSVNLLRATAWTQTSSTFTAPAGAVTLGWTFTTTTGGAGPAYRLDDLLIADHVSPPPPPVPIVAPSRAVMTAAVW